MTHHTHITRFAIATIAVVAFSGPSTAPSTPLAMATPVESAAPAIEFAESLTETEIEVDTVTGDAPGIYGADDEMTRLIEWGLDRYAEVGLELPELRIYVHDTSDGCAGHMGLYTSGDPIARIDICTFGQWVILHELAHAWEHEAVDDATRRRFLEASGQPVWNDWDHGPSERAIEDAANAIAFALRTDPIDLDRATDDHLAMLEAYELLTGMRSPRLD